MISEEQKEKFFEYLEETGTIHTAAKKAGVSRATIYRFIKNNSKFEKRVNESCSVANEFVTDIALNNVKVAVINGDMKATRYWLEHYHMAFIPHVAKQKSQADFAGKLSLLDLMDVTEDDPVT